MLKLTTSSFLKQALIGLTLVLSMKEIKAQVNSFEIDSSKLLKKLLPALATVYYDNQIYRVELGKLVKLKANQSQIDSVRKIIIEKDSVNVIIDNLDKRRKSMGLPPMSTYVANWNLDEYKNKLPEIENIVKQQNIKNL